MTDIRKWSAGAAVLAIAIFAAGWFLLVAPKHHATADLKARVASQEGDNARLQQQLQVLQAQQQDLPQQQAKLATLKTQIPDNPALPSLIRDLTAAGAKVGVSIDSMSPSPPVAVVAATPTTVSGATGPSSTAATATSLFQVPLALQITGSYFEIEQYLNKLEELNRSMMITGFQLGAPSAASTATSGSAGTGSSATSDDSDLTVTLNGRVFLTQDVAPTTTTPVAPAATTSGS